LLTAVAAIDDDAQKDAPGDIIALCVVKQSGYRSFTKA